MDVGLYLNGNIFVFVAVRIVLGLVISLDVTVLCLLMDMLSFVLTSFKIIQGFCFLRNRL